MPLTLVITGASRGLGLALARVFLNRGDRVVAVSQTRKHWKSAQDFLHPHQAEWMACDLTSPVKVERWKKALQARFPRVDLLINNAGLGGVLNRVEDTPLSDYSAMLDSNLRSAFLVSKALIPLFLKQKKGLIITVSSMAGIRAVPNLFAYSAAKFGIVALSQCIAKENRDVGLKCFTVCPGGMNTSMRASLFGKEDASRQQSPEFVAEVILKTVTEEIAVESGGDIVIRHGKITAIRPSPEA